MECFLKDNLLELRETLWNNKFGVIPEGVSLFGSAYAVTTQEGAGAGEHFKHFKHFVVYFERYL